MGKLAILFFISFIGALVFSIYCSETYDNGCGYHVQAAAHATDVATAVTELQVAITYLEENNLTTGDTGVLWVSYHENLNIMYKNLTDQLDELKALPTDTPSEKTAVILIKLKDKLLNDYGCVEDAPAIEVYPYNGLWQTWLFGSLLFFAIFILGFVFKEG